MAGKKKNEMIDYGEVVQVQRIPRKSPPARDPDSREKQMIAKTIDLVERQLDEGTASSAVLVHYLKLATAREKLEREILKYQAKQIVAKTNALDSAKENKELMTEAIDAMTKYQPTKD